MLSPISVQYLTENQNVMQNSLKIHTLHKTPEQNNSDVTTNGFTKYFLI